jgi:thiol-disulfide isomerase/thioredoxin
MDYFDLPVYYLQRSDFDDNGYLTNPKLKNKKVIVMLQANYCGWCKKAKPDFLEAAKHVHQLEQNGGTLESQKVVFTTIQADGDQPGESELNEIIGRIKPDFKGFPDYVLFVNGKPSNNNGPLGRDSNNIINYVFGK